MASFKLRLDHEGIARILVSAKVRAVIDRKAAEVAGNVEGFDPDAVVHSYTTDRAAASVTVLDESGTARQAADGVLTRAAAQAGLEVSGP